MTKTILTVSEAAKVLEETVTDHYVEIGERRCKFNKMFFEIDAHAEDYNIAQPFQFCCPIGAPCRSPERTIKVRIEGKTFTVAQPYCVATPSWVGPNVFIIEELSSKIGRYFVRERDRDSDISWSYYAKLLGVGKAFDGGYSNSYYYAIRDLIRAMPWHKRRCCLHCKHRLSWKNEMHLRSRRAFRTCSRCESRRQCWIISRQKEEEIKRRKRDEKECLKIGKKLLNATKKLLQDPQARQEVLLLHKKESTRLRNLQRSNQL